MRAALHIALLLLAASAAAQAELIDRIAATVGNRVITRSGLDREMKVTAFLDGRPVENTVEARRAAVNRMVEQLLVRRELETARYPTPAPSEVEPLLETLKRERFSQPGAYQKALEAASLTDQDVREALLWERTFLMFLEVRFRPGIELSETEIEDYFAKVVKPAAQAARPGALAELADYRARIEEKLLGDKVDRDVDAWLKEVRTRTEIVIHEEALQ